MVVNTVRQRTQNNSNRDVIDGSYAERPPRTPSPTAADYPEYQQMRISNSSTSIARDSVQNASYHGSYISLQALATEAIDSHNEPVPSYEEIMNRDQQNNQMFRSVNQSRSNSIQEDVALNPNDSTQERGSTRETQSLKVLGLNFLNARQHFALALCRDSVLIPSLYNSFKCFRHSYKLYNSSDPGYENHVLSILTRPSSSEHMIAGIWCIVAAYLSFSVIDGLMVRWIVTYQTGAAILRVLALSMLLITIEQATLAILSPAGFYSLHTWILISCILTVFYIVQSFVTSNLDLKNDKKPRSVDYYNITVFAVVPIGVASFISMIGLLRVLLILRLDLEREKYSGIHS